MRFSIERVDLARALDVCAGFTGGNVLPVLQTARVETREDSVLLSATDLEKRVDIEIPATFTVTGTILVPANLFRGAVRSLQDQTLQCEVAENKLQILHQRGKLEVATFAEPDQFPVAPPVEEEARAELPIEALEKAVQAVVAATAQDKPQTFCKAVAVSHDDGHLVITGTDTHRIHRVAIPCPEGPQKVYLVPAKSMLDAVRHLPGEKVTLRFGGFLVLEAGNQTVQLRTVDAEYPPVMRFFGNQPEFSFTPDTLVIRQMLKRALLLQADKVTLLFNGKALMRAETESGTLEEEIPGAIEGLDTERAFMFNPHYLQDLFEYDATLTLNFLEANRGLEAYGGGFSAVVLPLRVV